MLLFNSNCLWSLTIAFALPFAASDSGRTKKGNSTFPTLDDLQAAALAAAKNPPINTAADGDVFPDRGPTEQVYLSKPYT